MFYKIKIVTDIGSLPAQHKVTEQRKGERGGQERQAIAMRVWIAQDSERPHLPEF